MYEMPKIPEGLATKLGKYGTFASLALAALVELADIHLDEETRTFLYGAFGLLVTTMLGRYAQATAQQRDTPSPMQMNDFSGEQDLDLVDEVPHPETAATPGAEVLPPEGAVGGKAGES